ncbi:hypothetical protein PPUJ20028_01300 [Pseudomonas putida]|uniref:Uncharacterized protein n=1 Tax=Pseudomonas putida TaxID=303 RepID=A0AA37R8E0_PSEPU|nr:hypothetical protein [Pseudomonas putida]GLO11549.1 hypothetical protein PPUJ20028_01300 [Pseudomonas putida]GLO34478.1 hypothetical protein PPUN14671_13110 [Pseudomonas putida]
MWLRCAGACVGASITNHVGNLRDATVSLLYRKRVLWLVLLVFGNLFSGAGIAVFEETIAAHIVLVFFLLLLVYFGIASYVLGI